MTRPLTKRELALAATPLVKMSNGYAHCEAPFLQFLIANVCCGVAIGVSVAVLMLATDSFGIFTLISEQSAPVTSAAIFVIVSSFKFVALTIAIAVGIAALSK